MRITAAVVLMVLGEAGVRHVLDRGLRSRHRRSRRGRSVVFAVGNHVPWAEAGVGAVATQAAMNGGYGPRGLELLRQGLTAQQVIDRLLAEDAFDRTEGRQVAVVDAKGNVAVYTGPAANEWNGHIKGLHYSVQGNILAGPHVAEAMARAFENTQGELAERLFAVLSPRTFWNFAREFSSFRRQAPAAGERRRYRTRFCPSTQAIRLSRAVASRRAGPRGPVIGCR
jgi:hypothetical protein